VRGEGLLFESEDGRCRFLVHIGMPPVVVGRKPPYEPQNIRVPSLLVSRQHVRVTAGPNGYAVEDAGSTGGAWLDDAPVRGAMPIGAGARLKLNSETTFVTRTYAGHSLYELRSAGRGEPASLPGVLMMARDGRCTRPATRTATSIRTT
jgi:hypothetical protein